MQSKEHTKVVRKGTLYPITQNTVTNDVLPLFVPVAFTNRQQRLKRSNR